MIQLDNYIPQLKLTHPSPAFSPHILLEQTILLCLQNIHSDSPEILPKPRSEQPQI